MVLHTLEKVANSGSPSEVVSGGVPLSIEDRVEVLVRLASEIDKLSHLAHERIAYELDSLSVAIV